MDDNMMMDSMMTEATATLYAMEHEKVVNENFDHLYDLLVSSLDDKDFRKHIEALKPRGMVTKGLPLKPENNAICFAKKLWFCIQRTSSDYKPTWYYVGVGINLKQEYINEVGYKKVWIARIAVGDLEKIQEKICAAGFKERICKRLADHIYKAYYEFIKDIMNPDADLTKYV